MRLHLDTDLGSDTDDLCALAMLLGWPGAELAGVTTVTDRGGLRAGMCAYALGLAGRPEVPVAAGAEAGARVVAVGPYTNLALVETLRPGLLGRAGVVVMGGHVPAPPTGFPPQGPDDDFNLQQDHLAARVVLDRCDPLVVPLAVTTQVWLRAAHLSRLRAAGPLGALLADQGEAHARDQGMAALGRSWPGLPDDLLNFHHDPLACAVALGWDGVRIEQVPVRLEVGGGRLRMTRDAGARPLRVVTAVDGPGFEGAWLAAVERAAALTRP